MKVSKMITDLIQSHPAVFESVSYEDEDGIWLYLNPGWYCLATECGFVHEWSVREVLASAKGIYQDKDRYMRENAGHVGAIVAMRAGLYDDERYPVIERDIPAGH